MTQDHKVPTQSELDGYIAKAKIMRCEALASQARQLFQFPARLMKSLERRSTAENQGATTAS